MKNKPMIKTKKEILEEVYNETLKARVNSEIVIASLKDFKDDDVIVRHTYDPTKSKTKFKLVKEHTDEIKNAEIKLKVIKSLIDQEGGE